MTTVLLQTTMGDVKIELFDKTMPITAGNFRKLVAQGFYDGTIFHRVIPSFMIQGGDPEGTGLGDPGYKCKNETSPDLGFDKPGRLAYANAGPDTNGSQFFITEVPYPSLNGGYTIFGQCDDASVELVKQIARMISDPRDNRPLKPVKINHISIVKTGSSTAGAAAKPAPKKPGAATKPSAPVSAPPK